MATSGIYGSSAIAAKVGSALGPDPQKIALAPVTHRLPLIVVAFLSHAQHQQHPHVSVLRLPPRSTASILSSTSQRTHNVQDGLVLGRCTCFLRHSQTASSDAIIKCHATRTFFSPSGIVDCRSDRMYAHTDPYRCSLDVRCTRRRFRRLPLRRLSQSPVSQRAPALTTQATLPRPFRPHARQQTPPAHLTPPHPPRRPQPSPNSTP